MPAAATCLKDVGRLTPAAGLLTARGEVGGGGRPGGGAMAGLLAGLALDGSPAGGKQRQQGQSVRNWAGWLGQQRRSSLTVNSLPALHCTALHLCPWQQACCSCCASAFQPRAPPRAPRPGCPLGLRSGSHSSGVPMNSESWRLFCISPSRQDTLPLITCYVASARRPASWTHLLCPCPPPAVRVP